MATPKRRKDSPEGTPTAQSLKGSRIEYHSLTDEWGRCHFSLHWMADYHPGHPDGEYRRAERGQHFNADPRSYGFPKPEDAKKT